MMTHEYTKSPELHVKWMNSVSTRLLCRKTKGKEKDGVLCLVSCWGSRVPLKKLLCARAERLGIVQIGQIRY